MWSDAQVISRTEEGGDGMVASMTDEWSVWDADDDVDRQKWIDLWSSSAERHPFAHPDVCFQMRPSGGQLIAVSLSYSGGHVLYPFFLRAVDDELARAAGLKEHSGSTLFDIVSPYGYGGAMHWGLEDIDATRAVFDERFSAWAEKNSVICEFARLSLFEESLLPYEGNIQKRQTNYVRDLDETAEDLAQKVAPKVRSNVRRAKREGVTTLIDTDGRYVDDFVRIYTETMERRDSVDWYRFKRPFFEALHAALPGQFAYVYAQHDGRLVSADLLLFGREAGYYFLGGTESEAFRVRPNDLVKMESMMWLKAQGCRRYVLGGGVTAEDSLERYKKGFAPAGQVDYFTGERIFSDFRYDALLEAHQRRLAENGRVFDHSSDYFPAYRRDSTLMGVHHASAGGVSPSARIASAGTDPIDCLSGVERNAEVRV